MRAFHNSLLWGLSVVTLLILAGCGDATPLSSTSDIRAGGTTPGPTPFISFVPLSGQSLKDVVEYHYVIAAKEGAASKSVNVIYSRDALIRRGYYLDGSSAATLPVFGLYADYTNRVSVALKFNDGSSQEFNLNIDAPEYVDTNGVYDRPNILKKRSPDSALGMNYFFMKSAISGPIVVDTDGEVRWVTPVYKNGQPSKFDDNGFVVGDVESTGIYRIELDGRTSSTSLISTIYTMFHHNIDTGKFGLLGSLNTASNMESSLSEFSPSGTIINDWDFAEIIASYMRKQGDDPSVFVRPGTDWFHINAATYDPRDDSVIASSRENFVIKVDYSTGDIKWILGDPTKYWYTFPSLRSKALVLEAGGLYPIGQHATSINSAGLLMLFNDGGPSVNTPAGAPTGESRLYSAVSAYEIDPIKMTAREVLHFDYGKTILSDVCSSVYEAQEGSMLVDYAAASNRQKARLVGLDSSLKVIFDFEYASPITCSTSWNAQPIYFESMSIL